MLLIIQLFIGSGKSHTMYGPTTNSSTDTGTTSTNIRSIQDDNSYEGIIPRVVREIFAYKEQKIDLLQFTMYCSFIQIYNEQLYDMLRDSTLSTPLQIRENSNDNNIVDIYVQGLSEYHVQSMEETIELLKVSEENRKVRETFMNLFSSRSHSIFQIQLEQRYVSEDGFGEVILKSKLNLVDLAGSEKWNTSIGQEMKEEHITEMNSINLSLHTLGRCIASLVKLSKGKDVHIPYRDSKLTRLLQDSFGGNSRTFLLATISPSQSNIDESISTLKFADRAKQVMIQAKVNEIHPVDHNLVLRLRQEITFLRDMLRQYVDPMTLKLDHVPLKDEIQIPLEQASHNKIDDGSIEMSLLKVCTVPIGFIHV